MHHLTLVTSNNTAHLLFVSVQRVSVICREDPSVGSLASFYLLLHCIVPGDDLTFCLLAHHHGIIPPPPPLTSSSANYHSILPDYANCLVASHHVIIVNNVIENGMKVC